MLEPGGLSPWPYTGSVEVRGVPGVTYTLTARNDVGDVATATFSPVVLARPVISSVTVSPPHPAFLGVATVTAVFEGGTGLLQAPGSPDGVPITSGVPVEIGPLHGTSQLAVEVANGAAVARELVLVVLDGPGTWALVAGGPGKDLAGHTATLLADGRVLVAGGLFPTGATSPATLWDPATGASAPGPALLHPRSHHAAVRLADGRVLVAGGEDPAPVDEAEVLDLAAGTSTPAGSVGGAGGAWWVPQLVALPDGSAILHSASMFQAAGEPIFRFDPAAGAFAELATAYNLGWVQSVALADGRVLLLSGGRYALTPSQLLDPATGALEETGATLREMAPFEIVALADGRVLALDRDSPAQVFDPATGTFSWTGAPVTTGLPGRMVRLAGGEVLVAGTVSMRYDPPTGTFRETGGLFDGADRPLVLLPDGTVLATGGAPERYRP